MFGCFLPPRKGVHVLYYAYIAGPVGVVHMSVIKIGNFPGTEMRHDDWHEDYLEV
jgi:hypothetical protein